MSKTWDRISSVPQIYKSKVSQTQLMHHLWFGQFHLSPSPLVPCSWKAKVLLWPWPSPHLLELVAILTFPGVHLGTSRAPIVQLQHPRPTHWTTEVLFLPLLTQSIEGVPSSLATPATAQRGQGMQPGSVRELTLWETNFNSETRDERSQQINNLPSSCWGTLWVGCVL